MAGHRRRELSSSCSRSLVAAAACSVQPVVLLLDIIYYTLKAATIITVWVVGRLWSKIIIYLVLSLER